MSKFCIKNPFKGKIKSRFALSKSNSEKETQHIVLDISNSGLSYEVGDSVGIYAEHSQEIINKTLNALQLTQDVEVIHPKTLEPISFNQAISTQFSLTDVTTNLVKKVCELQTNQQKKEQLENILSDRDNLKLFTKNFEVWDFLESNYEVKLLPQELINLLKPLLPRFYSIASSQKWVGEEIHLTIASLNFESNGILRKGTCTHFMCESAEVNKTPVPLFIQKSPHFRLPEDHSQDIIMIGPGTGVAPFRAFLQERILHAKSTAKHWLFFGEKKRSQNFYYEDEWQHLAKLGNLRLELAFSRDQVDKKYVQHKMMENGREFYEWICNGAMLYVCGDASKMAKDVENTLSELLQIHGKMDLPESLSYIKEMRKSKRFLRDVY